jgi:glycosyltransferase involved in cell wall biosynthesis
VGEELGVGNPGTSNACQPQVAILLCTMQGQPHLREQLDSIVRQTHPNWSLWVSDDGSTDGTHDILAEYERNLGAEKLVVKSGPAQGYIKNFLSLVCSPQISASYYAYSDQDDIWEPGKLAHALEWLQTVPAHQPALYCGRTCNVTEDNQFVGLSPLFAKKPGFANALVQSIAGGNTMVFNHAACDLLRAAGPDVQVASHDWWTYLVVSGCGGQVFYDPQPTVRYRQHGGNLIGTNNSWADRVARLGMTIKGRFSDWTDMNTQALIRLQDHLSPDSARQLSEFSKARSSGLLPRLAGIKCCGVYRQTRMGNLGLVLAALLKKI